MAQAQVKANLMVHRGGQFVTLDQLEKFHTPEITLGDKSVS